MALQSILHDPNISKFLDQIPQNEHIITLKQLIYIGIKIVSNSFNEQNPTAGLLARGNKENQRGNHISERKNKKTTDDKFYKNTQNDKKFKKSKNHAATISNHGNKIQSTLLRQISKIRLQLQSLTNKVYDHYFDQNKAEQSDDSINYNPQKQANYIQSNGFNYPEDIPTFSPQKHKLANSNSYASNPFMKQKNNFLMADNYKKIENHEEKAERRRSHEAKNSGTYFEEGHRCRAKSNIMHLDDTQVRQALYKDPNQESEPEPVPKNKQKKSHSMIEKRHQQKKKDQQNYFYQLNLDKKNLQELQKFQQFKQSHQEPDASYRDFTDNKPRAVDHFKKKAKSKIKYLVERDRVRYQTKLEEEKYKKGFEQYEESANDLDEDEEDEESEHTEQEQEENDQYESQNQMYSKQESSLKQASHKQQKSGQSHMNSAEVNYENERNVSGPNFGFYDSKNQSEHVSRKESTFNNNQSFPSQKVKAKDNQQSFSDFSQFSQFSMSSSNSKREVGKISRKRNE